VRQANSVLIINADDYGSSAEITDKILVCQRHGRITSVSAMVFMADSERAAKLALENNIDVGLHLNFTLKFNGHVESKSLGDYQQSIASFLKRNKYCQLLYHPSLRKQFEYVYSAQHEEFVRLYRRPPSHIDGHEHMHLCMNLLVDGLIPKGSRIRRNLTFFPREKNTINRLYRWTIDWFLKRRYICTDFFFDISPISNGQRLRQILGLAKVANVELMVHPGRPNEFMYLLGTEYLGVTSGVIKAAHSA